MKQYHYEQIQKPNRNTFDLSHELKTTGNIGKLIPVLCQEVIPGDKVNIKHEMLIRNMPLIAPMMHRVNVYMHTFYVPNRIIFEKFPKYITNEETINHPKFWGSVSKLMAVTEASKIGGLPDYFGIPVQRLQGMTGSTMVNFSQLPFRAYQKIFNEYYRDQTLVPEVDVLTDELDIEFDNAAFLTHATLRDRALEKDYFTSALPTPQFGDPVTLPIGDTAPIVSTGEGMTFRNYQGADYTGSSQLSVAVTGDPKVGVLNSTVASQVYEGGLEADLSLATATSVYDLRRAYALQKYKELLMRGGRRLVEWTLNVFGVKVPDSRVQRPEYLGGTKVPLQISEVLQTFGDTSTENPLAGMAGHGIASGNGTLADYYVTEHGFIMTIMSIMPRTSYFQGLPKHLIKFDPFEYFVPHFAHIGEQAIKNKELYWANTYEHNEATFGYTPRYAEYRDNPDRITGEFRTTLKHWHMAKEFANLPVLNSDLIHIDESSTNRVFAVQSTDEAKFLIQLYFKIYANRPIPKFGNPI